MISISILIILVWSFCTGYTRGLIRQGYYFLSALVSMIVAEKLYQNLSGKLILWVPYISPLEGSFTYFFPTSKLFVLDKVFYSGLAYLLTYSFVYGIARFMGIFVHLIPSNFVGGKWAHVVSGFLAMVVSIFVIEMLLTLVATIPVTTIQDSLNNSYVSRLIINRTPIFSSLLERLWVTYTILGVEVFS